MGSAKEGVLSKSILLFGLLIISPLSGFFIETNQSLGLHEDEPSAVVVVEDDPTSIGRKRDDCVCVHPGAVSVHHEIRVDPSIIGVVAHSVTKVF